jgi:DNA adenine methylase
MSSPFFRWSGGKRQLLPVITENLPNYFNRYYEPFLGGGALFFHLERKNALISDTNYDLICAYRSMKDNLPSLLHLLEDYASKDCDAYFQSVKKIDVNSLSELERGARFIYLIKTCFNGLYRVNSKGEFNTSYGYRDNPGIIDLPTYIRCNEVLNRGTIIQYGGYELIKDEVKDGDFVYMDPPYDPLSNSSSFVSYTKDGFSRDDQVKLKKFVDELTENGVSVMISNNWTDFIVDLWKDYNCQKIDVKRSIAGDAEARGMVNEILIMNYQPSTLFVF